VGVARPDELSIAAARSSISFELSRVRYELSDDVEDAVDLLSCEWGADADAVCDDLRN